MNGLKDLTLIIPTYNRPIYAIRQLNYWSDTGACVHVIDGSYETINESLYDKSNPNLNYHFLGNSSIEDRLGYAINLIKTNYSALISDDEFFLPSAIEKCIKTIEINNLVACKGLCFSFNYLDGKVVGNLFYPGMRGYKINADTSLNRMIQHMNPYAMASLWSIMKSDVTIACLEAASLTGKLSSAACVEIQTSLITSFLGSVEVIDDLFWLRSQENKNIWWKEGNTQISEWYTDPNYQDEVKHFLQTTSEILSQKVGTDKTEILDNLKVAINHHIKAPGLSLRLRKKCNTPLRFVKNSIKLYLPKFEYLLRKILNKPSPDCLLTNIIRMFDVSRIKEQEIKKIIYMIEKTHKPLK
jgi:glycosyltransferase domain-containing protein